MIYGYCRISTRKQSIERQIRNIKAEFPDAVIIQETYTGTKLDRKTNSPNPVAYGTLGKKAVLRGKQLVLQVHVL